MVWSKHILTAASLPLPPISPPPLSPALSPPLTAWAPPIPPPEFPACLLDPLADVLGPPLAPVDDAPWYNEVKLQHFFVIQKER